MGSLRCAVLVITVLLFAGCDYLPGRKPSVDDLERCARAVALEAEALVRLDAIARDGGESLTKDTAMTAWTSALRYRAAVCSGIVRVEPMAARSAD
jgi:hypothetical protein